MGSPEATAARDGKRLLFDVENYTTKVVTVDNETVLCRAYEGIVYVASPVDSKYQSLNIYVPARYYEGKSIGAYTAETAPIFLPNHIGGYMPALPGAPGWNRTENPDAIAVALTKGYVVASPGARGRTSQDQAGKYIGKAPACIVDLKAAVRYLRHNDKRIPGDAEKIISNGTSAGGAISALLGATGNHPDYEPYLKALGAAHARDDIFAASCYCPITNLNQSDNAYEWMFDGIIEYYSRGKRGVMTAEQVEVSSRLKTLFPTYLNSLGLRKLDGTTLSLEANGEGTFKAYVKTFLIASAQDALDGGTDLSQHPWISVKGRKVDDLDFEQYVRFAGRMKTPPAFDALDLSTAENQLFGTESMDRQHFTPFSKENSADHSMADAAIISMMNPMNYIGTAATSTAPHWRIRHGVLDKDTALAIPIILSTRLQNAGLKVDFALPWGQEHGGDYDLDKLFAWTEQISQPN